MKKKFLLPIIALLLVFLVGCSEKKEEPTGAEPTHTYSARTLSLGVDTNIGAAANAYMSGANKEETDDYDEDNRLAEKRIYISLSDNNTTVRTGDETDTATYVTVSGNLVIIERAGTYDISGTLTNGRISIASTDLVQLVLNGVSIHCEKAPAIEGYGRGKKIVTAAAGTENFLSDGDSRPDPTDTSKYGVICTENTLTINGKGTLNIAASYKSAIRAGAVKIIDTRFSVTESIKEAIQSRTFIYTKNANISMECVDKNMVCEDELIFIGGSCLLQGKGVVAKEIFFIGSDFSLSGNGEGILSSRLVSAENSTLTIAVSGDGIVATGIDMTKVDGIVRLSNCQTLISDGDNGIRARFLSCSGGKFFCYGMGTQLHVTEGIETALTLTEILLTDPIPAGKKLSFGDTSATLLAPCRIFVSGNPTHDEIVYLDGEKYASR